MLENVDLSRRLGKKEFKERADPLRARLGELQREAKAEGIPVLIVFEGWDASGKGVLMNELILPLDPRGFEVHNVSTPAGEEVHFPPMHRFWTLTPAKGRIGIFNRSWYRLTLDSEEAPGPEAYETLRSFERQLAADGALLIKFFLHISKKEQRKRLKKLEENRATSWRVRKEDWQRHERYEAQERRIEEMLLETDRDYAPWVLVEAENREFAVVKILSAATTALERAIGRARAAAETLPKPRPAVAPAGGAESAGTPRGLEGPDPLAPSVLRGLDLDHSVERERYRKELKGLQEEFREIQYGLYRVRRPMVVAFEGMDAAGKGGAIKRLTQELDPRGYQVNPTAAPNDLEKAHHYLWRFWRGFPKAGHVAIYDRTWYGRVMVERVEGFCTEPEWRRAYGEIVEMEKQWSDYGTILVKFWLQIGSEEQLRRFRERQETPEKQWKITDEDWRNREKWPLYEAAVEEMLLRTSTPNAPWTLVASNCKEWARLRVLRTCVETARRALEG